MKLTSEHIGKKVRRKDFEKGKYLILEWLYKKSCAGRYSDDSAFTSGYANEDDWELVPENKRPSEIILNAAAQRSSPEKDLMDYISIVVDEICKYLDKLHAAGKI